MEKSARARGLEHTYFSVLTYGRLRKTKLKENFFGGKTKSRDAQI
jgi:hypothetical protein